jgi:hypothetical protein
MQSDWLYEMRLRELAGDPGAAGELLREAERAMASGNDGENEEEEETPPPAELPQEPPQRRVA